MKRLTSNHAEDVGGFVVEPGAEFDESKADADTVKRLTDEGKIAKSASAKATKKGDE